MPNDPPVISVIPGQDTPAVSAQLTPTPPVLSARLSVAPYTGAMPGIQVRPGSVTEALLTPELQATLLTVPRLEERVRTLEEELEEELPEIGTDFALLYRIALL